MSPSERLPVAQDLLAVSARELTPGDLVLVNRLVNLEQVLPNVTHEINNALQVISGLGEILASRPGMPEDDVQKLRRMHAQSVRCYGLLRELLAYARRDDAAPAADVARGVERALNLRRYHLSRGKVTVSVVPGSAGGLMAQMDSQHFEQVLVNLLINAEQAMAGRAEPTIRIDYVRDGRTVVVTVSDSGPGVEADRQEDCFAPFMTTRQGALGLGLTAARALAAVSGGDLQFAAPNAVRLRVPAK